MIRTPDSPSGRIEYYPMMETPSGIPSRDVWVYLPPGYSRNPDKRYPVLYLHDGQQVWDSFAAAYGGWKVDSAEEALLAAGKVKPFIIVGIKNSMYRVQEFIGYSAYYGPAASLYDARIAANSLSIAEAYREFVCDRLKPFIDGTYRTLSDRDNTAIGGASFGASVSLYIAFTRPELFSKVAALSGGNYLPEDTSREQKNIYQPYPWLIANAIGREAPMKIYLDCGGLDVDAIFLPRTQEMIAALRSKGYREGVDMLSAIDPRAGHNEREWAKRMPACLEFLFPAR
jgi:predicted alpha/beta superfamily hydrolase